MLATLIQRYEKKKKRKSFLFKNEWLPEILQAVRCHHSDKYSDIFHVSTQNIDCGYLLELPQRGSCNEYPCKPKFYYIKVGLKGVSIIYVCFRDAFYDCINTVYQFINPCPAEPGYTLPLQTV